MATTTTTAPAPAPAPTAPTAPATIADLDCGFSRLAAGVGSGSAAKLRTVRPVGVTPLLLTQLHFSELRHKFIRDFNGTP